MQQERIRFEKVSCVQDGVTVLDKLDLYVFAGEMVGLLFLDEQGKRALVELMLRNAPLHYGRVYYNDLPVNSYQGSNGKKNPVTLISHKNPLVNGMTVADNVFVIRGGFKKYLIQPSVLNAQFAAFAREAGVTLRGDALVESLSVYERCVVQLLKAVILGHKLVIIQDISNLISQADLARFHGLMRHFAGRGISFVYICGHHEEVFAVCHRALVLENGQVQKNLLRQDLDSANGNYFSQYMLSMQQLRPAPPNAMPPQGVLCLEDVYTHNLACCNFGIDAGECVVLLDAGNTALGDVFDLLSCRAQPAAGRLLLGGAPYPKTLHEKNTRVGIVQQSPAKTMLYPEFSYLDNLCFLAGRKQPGLWRGRAARRSVRREYLPLVGGDIDAPNIQRLPPASLYSLVYYGQHLFNPRLVVVMQPFLGADMYLRRHILFLINQLLRQGIAVLLLAVNVSDSPVVASRMLVMEGGRITREYGKQELEQLNRSKGF